MRFLVILLLACGLYGGYQWWQDRPGKVDMAAVGASDFVQIEMPGGVARNTVLVLAPPNCPSEQAQRTKALVRELTRAGIPVKRDSGFDGASPTVEQIERIDRTVAVFKRGTPAVFVNGLGMSNPTAKQTIAV